MDKKSVIITAVVTIISCLGFFISGYFTYPLMVSERSSEKRTVKVDQENKIISNDENESTLFLSGKHYFDDTVLLITKDEPHYTLVATVNRSEKDDSSYIQNTRVSFFNGIDWKRILKSDNTQNSAIKNNEFVNSWIVNINENRVLKQSVTGELNVDNTKINFDTSTLENEISIRSLPGYTKFMSEGSGFLVINNEKHDAYVLYTRIYSSNASELLTYDGNIGLLTDWVAFWDNDGNFYHVDSTEVKDPTPNYQTHSIGVWKSKIGSVLKTFEVKVVRDDKKPPINYALNLGYPINKSLRFDKYNDINKAPNNSYVWHMGNIKNENGIGLVEYIFK